jgi:hypothetical protein
MPGHDAGDWGEYRRLLIGELERLDREQRELAGHCDRRDADMREYCAELVAVIRVDIENLRNKTAQIDINGTRINQIEKDSAQLKTDVSDQGKSLAGLIVKSGAWGAIGGLLPVIVAILVWLMTKGA